MKKLLTILCLVLLSPYSYSQEVPTGISTEVTPVDMVYFVRGSQNDVVYHRDTNELFKGVVEVFNKNSQLSKRTTYKKGKKWGLMEMFCMNGGLEWRENYVNGVKHGLSEKFLCNNQVILRRHFNYGERDGLWESFDEDGNLTETQEY